MLASTMSARALHRMATGLCPCAPVMAAARLCGRAQWQGGRRSHTTTVDAYDVQYDGNAAGDGSSFDPSAAAVGNGQPPVFISFDVYKSKGALSIKPIMPTWQQLPKGGFQLQREGVFYFELAPTSGERAYAWDKKVALAMSCMEIANILDNPNKEWSFYHDPSKGKPGEGQVQKTLKWSPSDDGRVYFINASVRDKTTNTNLSASCNMTPGELYLFKRLADHAFPFLMGWTDKLQAQQ